MRKLMTKKLAVAVALSGLAAFAPAHAYVMAGSMVNMTNFVILGSGGVQLTTADFSQLSYTDTSDQSVSLTGFAPLNNTFGPAAAPNDFAPICVGGGCSPIAANNAFPKPLAGAYAGGNYAAADQVQLGSPVSGLSGFGSPAWVGNAAYTAIDTGSATSSANSNNNLNATWRFVLTQSTGITFQGLVDAFLQVAISGDEIIPSTATASYQFSFQISDIDPTTGASGVIFSFEPDLLGINTKTQSLVAPIPGGLEIADFTPGPIAFSATTPVLQAGVLYALSARINTQVDAGRVAAVPEPAMLSLVGLGLLVAGFGARRRMKKA